MAAEGTPEPRSLLRRHRLIAVLLSIGLAVRVATMAAYPPALFFGDSWGYVVTAFSGHTLGFVPVALSSQRPSGYPLLLWLLSVPGRDLVELVAWQHLAGLAIGLLVYASLLRAGVARAGAAAAASLVLLDGYAITLEQYVMADTFFALTVLVALLVLAWPALESAVPDRPGVRRAALAGLLIAAATLERVEGLFALPVLALYVLWRGAGLRGLAALVLAAALPLLVYATAEHSRFGGFGITQETGWVMYGRVAGFADCDGAGVAPAARPLCETAAQRATHPGAPTWYIYDPASPAVREFGPSTGAGAAQRGADGVLRGFAIHIILHQPLAYLSATASDFLRFFTPGATAFDDSTSATSLPRAAAREDVDAPVRARWLPGVQPRVRSPSAVVRAYRRIVHVPRPVLALLALASLVALGLRAPGRREVLLFSGAGGALLLGTAATAGFGLRYLLCAVPPLAVGGALAAAGLWKRRANG